MADTLVEVKFEALHKPLPKVKEEALFDALAHTLAVMEPETLSEHWLT